MANDGLEQPIIFEKIRLVSGLVIWISFIYLSISAIFSGWRVWTAWFGLTAMSWFAWDVVLFIGRRIKEKSAWLKRT